MANGKGLVGARRTLPFAVLVLLTCALETVRFSAPSARDVAPLDAFAAGRALGVLRTVLADERPHHRGTEQNRAVRRRIEDELRRLGLEPRVDRSNGCRGTRCAPVENIVATFQGSAPRDEAVLLACHYDSVPSGPGASDDGAGVATLLEVARALLAGGRTERDVIFLFDDGEEEGLLGADAFVRNAPEFARIGAVVNVEARGTEGPSMMFETQGVGVDGIRAMARALPRPVTSSLFGGVYERMPNDTDLTVFGHAGLSGYNFAFIRGASHYHRSTDDLAHLSPDSLQHHGDNVLGMARTLGSTDVSFQAASKAPRAVWFDVLSLFVVVWPERWSPWLSLGELVLLVLVARRKLPVARGWAAFAALGFVVSCAFAPASYLFVAPAMVAALGLTLVQWVSPSRQERARRCVLFVASVLGASVWFEVFLGLRDAFG